MGAQTFRSGIVAQQQVVDVLNEHFVCIEYDPSLHEKIPADEYPGLKHMAVNWEQNPWTRVSFGVQWILEPGGQYMLAIGSKAPARNFGHTLELGLKRFMSIRMHPRGSPEEAQAQRVVEAELEDQKSREPMVRTKEVFNVSVGDPQKRFLGVLEYPDPKVRAQAADLLGQYAEREQDTGFRPGGPWDSFGTAVARCLDDEDADVRATAARAMHQFFARPLPAGGPDVLIASAKGMWGADPTAHPDDGRAE